MPRVGETTIVAVDLSSFVLPVLHADAAETEAHARLLADLDQAAGGACKWRALEPAQPVA